MSFAKKVTKLLPYTTLAQCGCFLLLFFFAMVGVAVALSLKGGGGMGSSTYIDLSSLKISEEQKAWLKQNIPIYQQAASIAHVPWQMLAAINYRESGLAPGKSILAGCSYCQYSVTPGDPCYSDADVSYCKIYGFNQLGDAVSAAYHLQGKAMQKSQNGKYGGRYLTEDETDENLIKWAFYGYNGIGYDKNDPNSSPYVMNNPPTNPILNKYPPPPHPDANYGAFIIYKWLMGGGI